jgi:hypothetical protein
LITLNKGDPDTKNEETILIKGGQQTTFELHKFGKCSAKDLTRRFVISEKGVQEFKALNQLNPNKTRTLDGFKVQI